ncbi:hypothetical protein G6045_10035 [Streptomyces sp. YC504]|uniref:Secreted protein n=1 Tax=Streptomyces mesophilus TaxID=1775132 RepID=A0A6G4XGP9_9ACTN|nr:hypothetical protein [Streptomyces mesophilus]NGO76007.1 hypothetical protein [Streptomyces mesophilus]
MPDNVRPLNSSTEAAELRLKERRVSAATLAELDSRLPNVGVAEVLASANHPMPRTSSGNCHSSEVQALPVDPSPASGYCWDDGDDYTQRWLPQGVTSSGDADNDGMWGDSKVILSGWKSNDSVFVHHRNMLESDPNGQHLARVAFIDAADPANFKYRWVLLVIPTEGGANFDKAGVQVGGMVWFGDKLIVTAKSGDPSTNALYVFSMRHILQATVNSNAIGRVSGGYSAHGYQYVMPAIGSYGLSAKCGTDSGITCAAHVSLDRSATPDSIVLNEYQPSGTPALGKMWSYHLAAPSADGMPLVTDASGYAKVTEMFEADMAGAQGSLSYLDPASGKRSWYLPRHRGGIGQWGVYQRRDANGVTTTSCVNRETPTNPAACWAAKSQGLTLWWSTKTVWSQTEWAANRVKDSDPTNDWVDETVSGWRDKVLPERVLFSVPLSRMP